jgi:hypothetical protein
MDNKRQRSECLSDLDNLWTELDKTKQDFLV